MTCALPFWFESVVGCRPNGGQQASRCADGERPDGRHPAIAGLRTAAPVAMPTLDSLRLDILAGALSALTEEINLVMERGSVIGETLLRHSDVAGVSFTGSVATGRKTRWLRPPRCR
jgi:hypothetical protein